MVDAVLEIMQKAVVPWSNAVENLVQQYLEMDGPKYIFIYIYVYINIILHFVKNMLLTGFRTFFVDKSF